ncbi:thiamine pyrophosphate-binding protein [Streptomyces albicerus]|uniref:thiamine pyrophosphate-binding protein n=1 Tax=Streptomyces albicerus TaxID=2569859 RepID=UPI00124B81DC|nr:thiamine pyrophosphate-binding protein [Streptomyces albicerus]
MTTLAEAIGQTLAEDGVRHAFGVVANGNVLAVAGLTRHGVRYLSARHEGGAATMADAYYRTTGEVAVCTTGSGPGLTNTATGLADAVKHRSGVLLLCGDVPSTGPRRIDIDQNAFLDSLGVPVMRLTDLATARTDTLRALRRARGEQRPVALCLPHDLITAQVTEEVPAERLPERPRRKAADATGTAAALEALAAAERPLVLGGLGAWRSGAAKVVTELGDRLGALYATSAMAGGLFAGNTWSLGVCGGFASPRAAELIGQADVVLAFGASLDQWTLADGGLLAPEAMLVQVDTAPAPTTDRVDLLVTGDATDVAAALLDGVQERGLSRSTWRDEVTDQFTNLGWDQEPFEEARTDGRIDPRTLTLGLAGLLPEARTLVTDGGHFVGWPAMYWSVPDPAGYVFTGAAFQSIGLGFAGAVGAAVGRPDRTTVVALGDGGALMGLPELETLVRTGRSVLVVIYDDGGYGMEVVLFGDRGADPGSMLFGDTDFAATARALGARSATVRSVDDLAVVRDWQAQGAEGVLLLDCKVVPGVVADCFAGLTALISGRHADRP